jgi:hypothetical protein
LGFTLLVLGLLIGGLGIMAGEGRVYVLIISMLIISGGIWLHVRAS